jgi:predicted ArsR family transcriptional regulator
LSRAQARVLTALRAQPGPVTLSELSEATELHPNTLREHLEALQRSGLLRREPAAPAGPGRPAWLYRAAAVTAAGHSEYAGLAGALAATIHRTSADPAADAALAGTDWGHELAAGHGRPAVPEEASARGQVVALLDEIGFAPESDSTHAEVRLTQCPLLETAVRYPDVVCNVHLGIVRGALEEFGADPAPTELHPFSEPGACRLRLAAGPAGRR